MAEKRIPTEHQEDAERFLDEVGFNDLELSELVPRLNSLYSDTKSEMQLDRFIKLKEIHICGSYARDEALEVASDLDVRFVVANIVVEEEIVNSFSEKAKQIWFEKYSKDEDPFGYVDAWIKNEPPEQDSVRVV